MLSCIALAEQAGISLDRLDHAGHLRFRYPFIAIYCAEKVRPFRCGSLEITAWSVHRSYSGFAPQNDHSARRCPSRLMQRRISGSFRRNVELIPEFVRCPIGLDFTAYIVKMLKVLGPFGKVTATHHRCLDVTQPRVGNRLVNRTPRSLNAVYADRNCAFTNNLRYFSPQTPPINRSGGMGGGSSGRKCGSNLSKRRLSHCGGCSAIGFQQSGEFLLSTQAKFPRFWLAAPAGAEDPDIGAKFNRRAKKVSSQEV